MPDRVPFVIWNNKLPGDDVDRKLFELEACIVNKSTVYRLSTPCIQIVTDQVEAKEIKENVHRMR